MHLIQAHQLTVVHACRCVGLSRSQLYYRRRDWLDADGPVITAINRVLNKVPRAGFWKVFNRLQRQGHPWNHKRVYRVYKKLKLNIRRRPKNRLPKRLRQPLDVVNVPNAMWALDFVHDSLYSGKRFRVLNVIDEGTRECLVNEIDTSLPAGRVVRVLERLKRERGKAPEQIRLNNGPECISDELAPWCEDNQVSLAFIQPGKPQQNGFVERFNGSFRHEFLDAYLFESITQVQELAWIWRLDFNDERPHDGLGGIPPSEYRRRFEEENSTLDLF